MDLSDLDTANNLVELFLSRADAKGDAPFLGAKRDGTWRTISWREAAETVCLLAENLRRIGLSDGDRVVLVSENRPEWCLADLAIMAAGCITVPAYTTHAPLTPAQRAGIVATGAIATLIGEDDNDEIEPITVR